MLFAKANIDQVRVIDEVMNRFCDCSRQRLNRQKTVVFFSKNVAYDQVVNIGERLEVGITKSVGKYLGVPINHSRITKKSFEHIVNKMKDRIQDGT